MINKITHPVSLGRRLLGCVTFVALPWLLSACSSSPTPNYYTLSPQVTPLASSNVRVIEVLPVALPDRLNRIPLVLQQPSGESKVLDNDRWTSTFSSELRDSLSAGLQRKLGAVDRYSSGMTGGQVSYRIATDFSHFDIISAGNGEKMKSNARMIDVAVAWIIKRQEPINVPVKTAAAGSAEIADHQMSCRMTFQQPVASGAGDIQATVRASSVAMERVIDAVAQSVVATEAKTRPTIQGVRCS